MKKITFTLFILVVLILCVMVYLQSRKGAVVEEKTASREVYMGGCYEHNHIATAEAPYTVSESVVIEVDAANKVTGTKSGTQSGPDMTNGYEGTLSGTIVGDTIDVVFSYVIEGSAQQEKEIYKIDKDALTKSRYVLIDVDGVLVPDLSSVPQYIAYNKVECL